MKSHRVLDTLRRHFPGLGPEEIADRLVTGAVRGTEAVGAGVGSVAALPTPPGHGLNITKPTSAASLMLSVRLRKELRRRLLALAVRKIPMLTPFMVGAAIGALLNHYDTTRLARRIRADLQARQVPWQALPRQESASAGADS